MKRTIYSIITLLFIAAVITGCKKTEVYSISISNESLTMLQGEQVQLNATVMPQGEAQKQLEWSSSDNAVASITKEGLVTAEGIGTATIIATAGDKTARCEVTVVKEGDYMMKVTLTKTGDINVTQIQVLMPAPMTNEYQEISNLRGNCGEYQNTNEANWILYYLTSKYTEGMEIYQTFDFAPKQVKIDFSKTPTAKNDCGLVSPEKYLGSEGGYINLNNSTIKTIGDSIWAISDGNIDYARKCYEYVATTLKRQSGWFQSLDEIIQNGGGKSSDFATFFINLVRYKSIPARHIIALKASGSGAGHVLADFYDEEYGWIPVDAFYKNEYPSKDYFGQYSSNLVIEDLGLTNFNQDGLVLQAHPLVQYYYWYKGKGSSGEVTVDFSFEKGE